jgi:mRNA interferase RelE/StbE
VRDVSYKVKIRSAAQKDLDTFTGEEYRAVAEAISALEEIPRPTKVKKLAGSDLWRVRVKKCRVIYAINDTAREIIVVRVARRSEDTYKGL